MELLQQKRVSSGRPKEMFDLEFFPVKNTWMRMIIMVCVCNNGCNLFVCR